MEKSLKKILQGYDNFRDKYVHDDQSIMHDLHLNGQKPEIMVIACCDSRVDPALILQCDPGDLFIVRNVANIVPPYAQDDFPHGTSAALEFGISELKVKHLILLGHSQCGGINRLLNPQNAGQDDFITNWVSVLEKPEASLHCTSDEFAQLALKQSLHNCMGFPWIAQKVYNQELQIHLWFFDIKAGQILTYCPNTDDYRALNAQTAR